MFGRASFPKEIWLKDWKCFDKISSDNKDYLLPQFAYKYNLVSWLSFGAGARAGSLCQLRQNVSNVIILKGHNINVNTKC